MPVGQGTLGESSSFSPLTVWVVAGCGKGRSIRDDSADILFQSFLQRAVVNVSGMVRDVHSLTLSIQHFLCLPQRRPPSKVPWGRVLERLSCRVTCPNRASWTTIGCRIAGKEFVCLAFVVIILVTTGVVNKLVRAFLFCLVSFFIHRRPFNFLTTL